MALQTARHIDLAMQFFCLDAIHTGRQKERVGFVST
jgi:hypothetical protein